MSKWQLSMGSALALVSGFAGIQTANAQADDFALEEIIVQARKRAESSQTIPVAVTAITPSIIQNEGAVDLRDLEGRVPNLVIGDISAAVGGTAIAIRGLSFEDVERSFEPTVGLVIDGVFISTSSGQLTNTFDFESIEVARGPQGTLFGRNTIGGVISVRRTKPTREFGLRAQATIAENGREEFGAVLNAPLTSKGGLKVFGFKRNFDGFYENITTGGSDGANDYLNFGATLDYDLLDNLNFLLTVEAQEYSGEPATVSLSQPNEVICALGFEAPSQCGLTVEDQADRFETTANLVDTFDMDEFDLTAKLTWDISDRYSLISITAIRDSEEVQTQDFDSTPADFFDTRRPQDFRQFTQEFQLNAEINDRINGIFGFFYLDSRYELNQQTNSPLFADPVLGPGQIRADAFQEISSFAFFADIDFDITDRLRLNVGGRYTNDNKRFRISNDIVFTAIPLTAPIFDTTTADPALFTSDVSRNSDGLLDETFEDFSPRVSLDYRFTDDIFGYVSWSQGFRAGGFNGRAGNLTAATTVYDSEKVNTFEIGTKTEFLDNRARLNATVFLSKYDDRQEEIVVALPAAPFQETVVTNASDSTFWGIELDGELVVTEDLSLVGSFSYLNAEFDEFPILSIDPVTGDQVTLDQSALTIRRAPEITYSISALYNKDIGPGDFSASLSLRFVDEFQTTIVNANPNIGPQIDPPVTNDTNGPAFNDPRGISEPQHTLNFTVGYGFEVGGTQVDLAVFGRNLLNDVGIGSALPVAGLFTFATLDTPRQFGGSVTIEY